MSPVLRSTWCSYLWPSEGGTRVAVQPPRTKPWDELMREAKEDRGSDIPDLIKNSPVHGLSMLLAMPHSWSSGGVRWVASRL